MRTRRIAACAAVLIAHAPITFAHVTIDPPKAQAGAYQKLSFKVGHGCEGSATIALTVQAPDGILGAKPMPKTGWTIATVEAKLAAPLQSHGKSVSSTVREVAWRGGPLPDAWYDEFSMQVKLPDAPGRYVFKVSQQCEKGRNEWTPALEVLAPEAAASVAPAPAPAQAHQH